MLAVASAQLNTLNRYRQHQIFRADSGQAGGPAQKHGRNGTDLLLEVPVGTVISRVDGTGAVTEVLADLQGEGDSVLLARGGRGGNGNVHFKSPTHQAPRVAQIGQHGEHGLVRLELRLIADVGLVGLPNAGKSTLLRALTAATPRVADYPFTTLEPNLGVVSLAWGDEFVLADLPGLIGGAAEGAGLGHAFLRHTERTRLLVHVIDGSTPDLLTAYQLINRELAAYNAALAAKPQIVAINKMDLEDVRARRDSILTVFHAEGIEPLFLSAASRDGTRALAQRCAERLRELRAAAPVTPRKPVVVRIQPDTRRYEVMAEDTGAYRVRGGQVETFVEMMDLHDPHALEETHRWLTRRGVAAALKRAGARSGDRIRVREQEFTWQWDL